MTEIVVALHEHAMARFENGGDEHAAMLKKAYIGKLEEIGKATNDLAKELLLSLDEVVGDLLAHESYLSYEMGLRDGAKLYELMTTPKS